MQPRRNRLPAPPGPSPAAELRALYRLTDRLYRAAALEDVYEAALDAIVDTLGCRRASILLFDEQGVMAFVAARGLSGPYRRALAGHSPWKPGDRDPEPLLVSDILDTSEPDWIKSTIAAEGIRGLGFIPIVADGEVVGKFMTYYPKPHAFPTREVELATTIARQVGFSVQRARAERLRRLAEEGLRESEQRFRLLSEQAPAMIWMGDAAGGCLHLNRTLRAFWGVPEKDESGAAFDWSQTVHPDDRDQLFRAMQAALRAQQPVRLTARYRSAAGEYRVLETDARPRFSAKREFLGMIGVNTDITDRVRAEQALRLSEERFRLAVEAAPSGMLMTDGSGRILLLNANAEALFGYGREELIGRHVEVLVPEGFRDADPGFRQDYHEDPAARPMGAGRDLFALRKDGTELPVEIGLSSIATPDGVLVIAAILDISSRKAAEAQRALLLAELNHRVKNTLAVVQALAHQTFRHVASPEARRSFEGRLAALAAANDMLTREDWDSALLARLAADVLHAGTSGGERVALAGPRVLLSPTQAVALTLALHELFTNALKYGALSNDSGRVDVAWQLAEDDAGTRLHLTWTETGGPPVSAPDRRGFGSLLIERALGQDCGATVTIDYAVTGLICSIEAPLAAPAGEQPAMDRR